MRIRDGESYEEWAKRVQMYEHGHALQRIAEGDDIDSVLETMSKRVTEKLMHPIFKILAQGDTTGLKEKIEASRKSYEENYVKRIGPRADHILDDSIQANDLHDTKDESSS